LSFYLLHDADILTPVRLAPAVTFAPPAPVLTTARGRVVAEILFLLNRILLEKAGNEDGIEIRSNLNDRAIHKSTYPAIPVIEPETVFGGGVGMQLDHRPVTAYERMFHMQFRTFR
jgi:hypothetical protein